MNIGVIGVGGIGGYYGGKLTRLIEIDPAMKVYFIARGQHLEEIRKNGLLLDTDEGEFICKPTYATDNFSELPVLDLCLVCVKSYDLDNAMLSLRGKVASHTMILPLLNGVDIYERIRTRISDGIVLPACVYIGTHIEKPGKVTQRGGTCVVHFGHDPERKDFNKGIFNLFDTSGIKYIWYDNPYPEIWNKFLMIAPFGLVTANYDKTFGEILQSDELSRHAENIMKEIVSIAKVKGIDLPQNIVAETFNKAKKFPPDTRTSFQRDFENMMKSDERDLFGGTILRMGLELGISTDATRIIYDSIQKKKRV
jgi:2-dehydropantoate 2-reductase